MNNKIEEHESVSIYLSTKKVVFLIQGSGRYKCLAPLIMQVINKESGKQKDLGADINFIKECLVQIGTIYLAVNLHAHPMPEKGYQCVLPKNS